MSTEYTTNMIDTFLGTTGKLLFLLIFIGLVALLTKIISSMLPNKYRDGKIAPKITEYVEPDYIADLNKEMEEAGVDNLRDLEQYRENEKILNSKSQPAGQSQSQL